MAEMASVYDGWVGWGLWKGVLNGGFRLILGEIKRVVGFWGAVSSLPSRSWVYFVFFFGFVLEFYRLLSIFLEGFNYFLIFLLFLLPFLFEIHVGVSVLLTYFCFQKSIMHLYLFHPVALFYSFSNKGE